LYLTRLPITTTLPTVIEFLDAAHEVPGAVTAIVVVILSVAVVVITVTTVVVSVIRTKEVVFSPDDMPLTGEGETMLPFPVVLALQQATMVTGELVLPFIAAPRLLLDTAALSADVLIPKAITFARFASFSASPVTTVETIAARNASMAKKSTHKPPQ
jgi:hypothetical protein